MGSLRDRWRQEDAFREQSLARSENRTDAFLIDLLGGLAAFIRIRLSSLSAGPDAMLVGVAFTGLTGPLDGLPTLIRIAVACPSAGPDAMLVGVVFAGGPACTSGPENGLPARGASSGRRTRRGRVA
jgi:hypothetical protein